MNYTLRLGKNTNKSSSAKKKEHLFYQMKSSLNLTPIPQSLNQSKTSENEISPEKKNTLHPRLSQSSKRRGEEKKTANPPKSKRQKIELYEDNHLLTDKK